MSRLRKVVAKRLKEAQNTAAMLTTFNEVDMTSIMSLRSEYKDHFEKEHKVRLGFMGMFVKASISALNSYPCLLYTSPSPRDLSTSRMPSSA